MRFERVRDHECGDGPEGYCAGYLRKPVRDDQSEIFSRFVVRSAPKCSVVTYVWVALAGKRAIGGAISRSFAMFRAPSDQNWTYA